MVVRRRHARESAGRRAGSGAARRREAVRPAGGGGGQTDECSRSLNPSTQQSSLWFADCFPAFRARGEPHSRASSRALVNLTKSEPTRWLGRVPQSVRRGQPTFPHSPLSAFSLAPPLEGKRHLTHPAPARSLRLAGIGAHRVMDGAAQDCCAGPVQMARPLSLGSADASAPQPH